MMKKILAFLLIFLIILGGLFYTFSPTFNKDFGEYQNHCPFCDQTILDRQKFYEDDYTIALYTHRPIVPGHSLIIPKSHHERYEQLSDEEIVHIHHTIKKVHTAVSKVFGTNAYLLLEKNGVEVGQTVPHVHFHYMPKTAEDNSILKFLFRFYWASATQPISQKEMEEIVTQLKKEISEE